MTGVCLITFDSTPLPAAGLNLSLVSLIATRWRDCQVRFVDLFKSHIEYCSGAWKVNVIR